MTVATQEISTAATAAAGIGVDKLVEDSQCCAITHLCLQIEINYSDLLSDDVRSHPEFMKMLTSIAVSSKEYFYLFSAWKDNQTFVKSQSKVDEANKAAEKSLSDLKTGLLELSNMSVVTTTLAVQLRSCQEKLNKILSLLPNMFETKECFGESHSLPSKLHPCTETTKTLQTDWQWPIHVFGK